MSRTGVVDIFMCVPFHKFFMVVAAITTGTTAAPPASTPSSSTCHRCFGPWQTCRVGCASSTPHHNKKLCVSEMPPAARPYALLFRSLSSVVWLVQLTPRRRYSCLVLVVTQRRERATNRTAARSRSVIRTHYVITHDVFSHRRTKATRSRHAQQLTTSPPLVYGTHPNRRTTIDSFSLTLPLRLAALLCSPLKEALR